MYQTNNSCETSFVNYTILSANDFYAAGKILRSFNSSKYAYQGSEKDKELGDNDYYTHFRELEVEILRWKQVDPKFNPSVSPYASMENNPVMFNDVLGDEVGYEKFRDKVNVFFGRIFSKSFRGQYKRLKESTELYTFKRRESNPGLVNGGTIKRTGESTLDYLYAHSGAMPPPPPPPVETKGPLKDRISYEGAKDEVFEGNYEITDFSNSSLNVRTYSREDKIEIISGSKTTLIKNGSTNAEGYSKTSEGDQININLKQMNADGLIGNDITIRISGNKKYPTVWQYTIKADEGKIIDYSTKVKKGKVID